MSYIYSSDEYYGTGYAGYWDAPSYINSTYFVGTSDYAYGYLSSGSDVDVYSLGILYAGYEYSLSASGDAWAYNTYSGDNNTPYITLLDSYGYEVGTSYTGSMDIYSVSTGTYYVEVWDYYASQYYLTLDEYYVGFPNSAPTISNKNLSIAENSIAGNSVGSMTATDADGDTITYSIISGNTDVDGDSKLAFAINSSTGAITVNDAGDLDYEDTKTFNLIVKASDGDLYTTATATVVLTDIDENQAAGVTINGTDKVTGENGDTAVFLVKLDKAPVNSVTINFAVSDPTEAELSISRLTFTSSNWNTAQSLTVTGLDDDDNDGNVTYDLRSTLSTTDLSYKRVTVSSIGLTNNDDALDTPIQETGTNSVDYMQGNNGADRLYGQGDMDEIRGGKGDDRIYGENDDDVLYGDDGNDLIYGGYDDDEMYGGTGNDELYGEAGTDRLEGGAGNDYLDGGTGADTMVGGVGNDTYFVDNANDVIDDQGDTTDEDTVIIMATIRYTLASNVENAELNDASGAAGLTGNTLGNDLTGNASKNILDGGAGNDLLDAGAGNDSLLGGDGSDSLIGGLGSDILNGGKGDDLVDFTDAAAGFVNVDLSKGTASGDGTDTLISIEDVIGSDGADIIIGSTAGNELTGGLGNDKLYGGGGSDILYAGTGDDVVDAGDGDDILIGGDGKGNDKYIGGAGTDTVKYTSATAAITVDLVKGTATSTAGKDAAKIGTDTLSGIENVIAGKYNDIVKGNTGVNVLTGDLGTDSLYGGADKVKDVFDFNAITESKTGTARDKVYDFITKIDKLDLSGIDANTTSAMWVGDQAFLFNNTTAKANSVWYKVADVDGNTQTKDIIVYGDVNGNNTADFEIGLVGVTSISATDFVL
jgi:Ca2+-binding RTX toxin-like protein